MFFSETPPVEMSSICGSGALSDFRYVAPPTAREYLGLELGALGRRATYAL
jgi:hypothetical protein